MVESNLNQTEDKSIKKQRRLYLIVGADVRRQCKNDSLPRRLRIKTPSKKLELLFNSLSGWKEFAILRQHYEQQAAAD
jgi:hypothetical protein